MKSAFVTVTVAALRVIEVPIVLACINNLFVTELPFIVRVQVTV